MSVMWETSRSLFHVFSDSVSQWRSCSAKHVLSSLSCLTECMNNLILMREKRMTAAWTSLCALLWVCTFCLCSFHYLNIFWCKELSTQIVSSLSIFLMKLPAFTISWVCNTIISLRQWPAMLKKVIFSSVCWAYFWLSAFSYVMHSFSLAMTSDLIVSFFSSDIWSSSSSLLNFFSDTVYLKRKNIVSRDELNKREVDLTEVFFTEIWFFKIIVFRCSWESEILIVRVRLISFRVDLKNVTDWDLRNEVISSVKGSAAAVDLNKVTDERLLKSCKSCSSCRVPLRKTWSLLQSLRLNWLKWAHLVNRSLCTLSLMLKSNIQLMLHVLFIISVTIKIFIALSVRCTHLRKNAF